MQMPATRPLNAEPTEEPDSKVPQVSGSPFTIKYDKLVIAVGAYSQSKLKLYMILKLQSLTMPFPAFNIPGVKEHAHFLKDVKDARRIRSRILECAPLLS